MPHDDVPLDPGAVARPATGDVSIGGAFARCTPYAASEHASEPRARVRDPVNVAPMRSLRVRCLATSSAFPAPLALGLGIVALRVCHGIRSRRARDALGLRSLPEHSYARPHPRRVARLFQHH